MLEKILDLRQRKLKTSLLKVGGEAVCTTEDATQTDRGGEQAYEIG